MNPDSDRSVRTSRGIIPDKATEQRQVNERELLFARRARDRGRGPRYGSVSVIAARGQGAIDPCRGRRITNGPGVIRGLKLEAPGPCIAAVRGPLTSKGQLAQPFTLDRVPIEVRNTRSGADLRARLPVQGPIKDFASCLRSH